jgi:hypothetical protein
MWESEGLGSEEVLWASTAFNGGIASQQEAPCGAISSGTVCLGLRHRCPPDDKERAGQAREAARRDASQLVSSFREQFGAISCLDLLGIDFSDPGGYQRFRETQAWRDKCDRYVSFVIRRLYELHEEGERQQASGAEDTPG